MVQPNHIDQKYWSMIQERYDLALYDRVRQTQFNDRHDNILWLPKDITSPYKGCIRQRVELVEHIMHLLFSTTPHQYLVIRDDTLDEELDIKVMVATATGQYIIRIADHGYINGALSSHFCTQYLAQYMTKVTASQLIVLQEYPDIILQVTKATPGRPIEGAKANESLPVLNEMAKYAQAMHQRPAKGFGWIAYHQMNPNAPLQGSFEHWPDFLSVNLEYHLVMLESCNMLSTPCKQNLTSVWREHEQLLTIESGCLIHGDLHAGNILAEHGHFSGIIDWECAHIGDPIYELAIWGYYHHHCIENLLSHYDPDLDYEASDFRLKFHLYLFRYYLSRQVSKLYRPASIQAQSVVKAWFEQCYKNLEKLINS